MRFLSVVLAGAAVAIASPAACETPRELLVRAAFATQDKATALARIDAALAGANAVLARSATDQEAQLQRAIAISYRGKLNRNRADLIAARRAFEGLAAAHPKNAEVQLALGAWHLASVIELGPLMGRTMLGASKAKGIQALDRSLALGRGRALFPAFASLTRIQVDPADVASARKLSEAAVASSATAGVDRIMQQRAASMLSTLRSGDGKAAAKLAKRLLPFGRLN